MVCSPTRACVENNGQCWDVFPHLVLPSFFETGLPLDFEFAVFVRLPGSGLVATQKGRTLTIFLLSVAESKQWSHGKSRLC